MPVSLDDCNSTGDISCNMEPNARNGYEATILRAEMLWESDLEGMVFADYTRQHIVTICDEANTCKRELLHSMVALQTGDRVHYESETKDRAVKVKNDILQFIRKAQKYLTDNGSERASIPVHEVASDRGKTLKIKRDRVDRHKDHTIEQLNLLIDRIDNLKLNDPVTDFEYRQLEEDVKGVGVHAKEYMDEATSLCSDAVESGHEEGARDIEDCLVRLRQTRTELDTHMHKKKTELGMFGQAGFLRSDVKLPNFSGEWMDKIDYYTFHDEFNEYIKTRVMSKAEQLKLLKNTALTGMAKEACANFGTIDEVWRHLKENWGNVKTLFSHKVDEIRRLGRCSGPLHKQREWAVSVKTKLDRLYAMATKHGIEYDLYYSSILQEVPTAFPPKIHEKFRTQLKEEKKSRGSDLSREFISKHLLKFMGEVVEDLTFDIEYEFSCVSGDKTGQPTQQQKPPSKNALGAQQNQGKKNFNNKQKPTPSQSAAGTYAATATKPQLLKCVLCQGDHTHIYYCELFQQATVKERYDLLKNAATCFRCLRLDSKPDLSNRDTWWQGHAANCDGEWVCKQGNCANRPDHKQQHFLMCGYHTGKNKTVEGDFIKTLDRKLVKPNLRLLFMNTQMVYTASIPGPTTLDGKKVEPDIDDPSIFMIEHVYTSKKEKLLLFYDSGCTSATISSRAVAVLNGKEVRAGPTHMEVVGGNVLKLDGGDIQFHLELQDGKSFATMTGLEMEQITHTFPCWDLLEAYEDLKQTYVTQHPKGDPLPPVRDCVGGAGVDLMIGIKYNKYFPRLVYTLPCRLSIYESKFKSSDGRYGLLGGPHKAWRRSLECINMMTPQAFLTMETKVWYMQNLGLRGSDLIEWKSDQPCVAQLPVLSLKTSNSPKNYLKAPDSAEEFIKTSCSVCETNIEVGCDTEPELSYNIKLDEKRFGEVDDLGSSVDYRCVKCRNCSDCRKGEQLEWISLQEEREQALIESCIRLDTEKKQLISKLPFIADPTISLTSNYHIAERVLGSQLKLVEKNPEMLPDIIKSHDKLRNKGHVIAYDELPEEEKKIIEETPEPGYHIPWRTVYKTGSLTTPLRLVYDASQCTPNGSSLNNILAKGKNTLAKVLDTLINFRSRFVGFATDVSMAYNGVKLDLSHYKYQRYLWKEDLNYKNPTKVMIIRTFIYGVKCAGNSTTAGFNMLAEHCIANYPEHAAGAAVLRDRAYMDDVIDSKDTLEECRAAADSLVFTLGLGSMSVKAFSYSGEAPDPEVSSDGQHIGLLGMLWDTQSDVISLDIKPLYLGKAKRGRLPDPVAGDIGEALKKQFTRRIVTGKVAGIFDPAGLLVPFTSKLKLDLHTLCKLNLDWDDRIPDDYLDDWVRNLTDIQELKDIRFRRTIVPVDAVNTDIELITSVDASSNVATAVIHTRMKKRDGTYHVQLLCAKSKLVCNLTIPKGELRAAVLGVSLTHTVSQVLGDRVVKNLFVSDSTIVLYWLNQDERPLQTGVRNAVIEVRRLSDISRWFHVETEQNIADLPTRPCGLADLGEDSCWQNGKDWMALEEDDMPIKTISEITLTNEEKRAASLEMKNPGNTGVFHGQVKDQVAERFRFSNYIVDPCQVPWNRAIRVVAFIFRFLQLKSQKFASVFGNCEIPGRGGAVGPEIADYQLSVEEERRAEEYFFKKATLEVKEFSKKRDWEQHTTEKNGILYYNSRIIEGQGLVTLENEAWDLEPLHFVRPVSERHSPISYSVMFHCHDVISNHANVSVTLRESRNILYIFGGRDLAKEVRQSCVVCRRFKAKLVEVEMSKIHENRLTIAPCFYNVQVDLFGPYSAACEHNHRSTVDVWGVVFKDPATGAVAAHCMQGYGTAAFLQAYTRFAYARGHPRKFFIDEGSQLIKACKRVELNILDLTHILNSQFKVGIEYTTGAVGGHHYQGVAERSIREIKKLFKLIYSGLRLDIMSYETSFNYIANELNNLPICLGSRTDSLEQADVLTANRLLLGRNNRRAMSGNVTMAGPTRLLEQMELVAEAWWAAWKTERLIEFIPQPNKWLKTNIDVKVGDIVVFLKSDKEKNLGETVWKLGRITQVGDGGENSRRMVTIQYKNAGESVFRQTNRHVRTVAVLHQEGDLELIQELNEAAKQADVMYLRDCQLYSRACLLHPSCFPSRECATSDRVFDLGKTTAAAIGVNCTARAN